jgi:transitional endoplasmic reticulum ATPase
MDQYLRHSTKSLLGDWVSVNPISVKTVDSMVLAPFVNVSDVKGIEAYLIKNFASKGVMVSDGTVLYATLPGQTQGVAFKAVKVEPAAGLVTPDTQIELDYVFSSWGQVSDKVTFEDVGGLKKEIALIRELIELPLLFPDIFRQLGINPPRGIVLYGPPGSWKSHLARAIANEINAKFLYINGPDVVSAVYGETEANLRKIFEEASHHLPSIVFIDELDAIAPKRGESGSQSDTRMVAQLLELMDGLKRVEGVMVVGTTNRVESLDKAVRRPGRFDREIFIGPPDIQGRMEILQIHTRSMPMAEGAWEAMKEVTKVTHGFVGADMMELCREAGLNCLRRIMGDRRMTPARFKFSLDELLVTGEDFKKAAGLIRPSALRETITSVPDVGWEDIGGMEVVKERLRDLVERPLLQPEPFYAMGVKPPSGILLYGPPGTGKTLLAKAIARESGANFLYIRGPEIFSKWLGESEESIRHAFQVARQVAPAVIFFDQIDAVASKKGEGESKAQERVVNQILTEMDSIDSFGRIVVVAATNRIDLLDPAILRPGRFGIHIHVPLPELADRKAVLELRLKTTPFKNEQSKKKIITEIAQKTEGFSGAELEALCNDARLNALKEVDFKGSTYLQEVHFLRSLDEMEKSRDIYQSSDREAIPG